MDIDQARRIVSEMTSHVFYAEGLDETAPRSLAEYSLGEMLEANKLVKEADQTGPGNGPKTVQIVCDERLAAALYVLYHYEPNPNRAVVLNNMRYVVVAKIPDDFFDNPEYEAGDK